MVTVTLQTISEMLNNSSTYDGLADIETNVTALNQFLFDFPYTFYDDSEKTEFQKRFIRHFYMREIAFETIARFKLELMNVFQTDLPKYKRMFDLFYDESWLIKDNVDYVQEFDKTTNNRENWDSNRNYDRTDVLNGNRKLDRNEKYNETSNHNLNETLSENNEEKNAFSDTPQGTLTNVENNTYLTDYRNVKNNNQSNREMGENSKLSHDATLSDKESSLDDRKIKDVEGEKRTGVLDGAESWKQHNHGNYGVATNSKQYVEYADDVESPESLFFKLCDRKLFLMCWDL